MTAMSWKSSTAKAPCPPAVRSSPFSFRVCSTIAVEDIARIIPVVSAMLQASPSARPSPATASAVSATCSPPSPTSCPRIRQSSRGSSSRPTRNSIITTPSSAMPWSDAGSTPTPRSSGPITTPAAR